jgi:hypothetical protein
VKPLDSFPAIYGTRKFITSFTRAHHLSLIWSRPIQSTWPHPISARKIHLNIIHTRTSWYVHQEYLILHIHTTWCITLWYPPFRRNVLPPSSEEKNRQISNERNTSSKRYSEDGGKYMSGRLLHYRMTRRQIPEDSTCWYTANIISVATDVCVPKCRGPRCTQFGHALCCVATLQRAVGVGLV